MTEISETEIIDLLKESIRDAGSQRAYSRMHNISKTDINDIVNRKKPLQPKLLSILNIKKIVKYKDLNQ